MAMRKSDIEQENSKRNKDTSADFLDDDTDSDDSVEDIELDKTPVKDLAARKRLEDYLEEKRLKKELDDDLFDF